MTPSTFVDPVERLKTAMARHDRRAMTDAARNLLAEDRRMGPSWQSIARMLVHNGELSLARAAMRRFVAADAGSVTARLVEAGMLAEIGDASAALAIADALRSAGAPFEAGVEHLRGTILMTQGRRSEARVAFEAVLARQPLSGPTWLSLAMTVDLAQDPLGDRLLEASRRIASLPPEPAAQLDYAAGRLLLARGEDAAAFDRIAAAAARVHAERPYDPVADERAVEQGLAWRGVAEPSAEEARGRPIFVTGLPRSGTTLVEQILVSHSAVADGGELNLVQLLIADVGGLSPAAFEAANRRGLSGAGLATEYLRLATERFGANGRFVDKTLDLGRMLGLVSVTLPHAPIIWVRREPLDCAWSCLRTYFPRGLGWTFDQTAIAAHFRLEDRLFAHWRDRLGARLLVVPYEGLATDPATWTRTILDHCGLDHEQAPYAPHATARTIATASTLQVRRPIATDAIGSGDRFADQLAPFRAAYGGAG